MSVKKNHRLLVGDIGGTNCRIAGCDPETGHISHIQIYSVERTQSLEHALRRYKQEHPAFRYCRAAISIANPIVGDRVMMTNAHWDFSIEQTRLGCQFEDLFMLNDWESVALALPFLTDRDLTQINDCPSTKSGNRALCGVGTGLGAAGLAEGKDQQWMPIAGEGGHVSFSPMDQDEIRILEAMVDEHQHVSFERILSGAGMVSLYRAIAKINGDPIEAATPKQIVSGAVSQTRSTYGRTIQTFCGILGNFAGNLCLTLGATGGIYVGGGVIQKIDDAGLFDKKAFLERVTSKGRLSGWLNDVPAYLIKTPYAGLVGAAAALGIEHAFVSDQS